MAEMDQKDDITSSIRWL